MAGNRIIRFLRLMVGTTNVGDELADTILHKADTAKHREIDDSANSAITLFSTAHILAQFSPLADYSGANMADYSLPPRKIAATGTLSSGEDGYVPTYNHATGEADWQDMAGVVGADTYQVKWSSSDAAAFLENKFPNPNTSSGNEVLKINAAGSAYELGVPMEMPGGAGDAHKIAAVNTLGDEFELTEVGTDLEFDATSGKFQVRQTGATHDHAVYTTHVGLTSNPHSVTATQVGLGNCNNTADIDKPSSTAQKAEFVAKAGLDADLVVGAHKLQFAGITTPYIEFTSATVSLVTALGDSVLDLLSDEHRLSFLGSGDKTSTMYSDGALHATTTLTGTGDVAYTYEGTLEITAGSMFIDSQSGGIVLHYDMANTATTAGLSIAALSVAPTNDNIAALGSLFARWAAVYAVNGTIQTSDESLKIISPAGDCSWLYDLTPISFRWKDDSKDVHYGFTAQDVFAKAPKKDTFCVRQPKRNKRGKESYWGTTPTEFIAPIIQLLKDQRKQILDLEARINILEGK